MKKTYKTTRILELMEMMNSSRTYTYSELSRSLDVSIRTLHRYTKFLRNINFPIVDKREAANFKSQFTAL
jgi:predicted DNA-binding transcriptional regulator YafY